MFKLTFFEVGQGDCILLEWDDFDSRKLAIIDCKAKSFGKPTFKVNLNNLEDNKLSEKVIEPIKYINSNYPDLEEIEFILVSHPHSDHFSGISQILKYCDERRSKPIVIKYFFHTWQRIIPFLYLKNKHTPKTKELKIFNVINSSLLSLMQKAIELEEKSTIKNLHNIGMNSVLKLTKKALITFSLIAPHEHEYEEFTRNTNFWREDVNKDDSPLFNELSTVIEIFLETVDGKVKVVLSSDSEIKVLERYLNNDDTDYHSTILQIPHHGSEGNHYPPLYDAINAKFKIAVISCGNHRGYKHPSSNVLRSIHDRGYEIYSTNYAHSFFQEIGNIKSEHNLKGDVEFIFQLKE